MEGLASLVVALIGLVAIAVAIVVARSGRPHDAGAAAQLAVTQDATRASLELLQRSVADLQRATAESVNALRADVQRSLGTTEQQVLTQTGATQRSLADLSRQLGTLAEQSARIGDLAKDVGSLHDLLRAPKPRGGFGELLLERVLADCLPADAFELQYTYRDGSRVDAVVRFAGRLVPIDAKFPVESFQLVLASSSDDERRTRRRAFLQQVKRHIDAVARYVAPGEGTIDLAFLYVPAENVFYSAFVVQEEDEDMRAYCAQRHVIPTSPNTLLAYLQIVSLGLRGLAIQERSRELHQAIRHAAHELDRFRELHDQLGRHVENASKKFTESLRSLDRAADAIEGLARVPLASAAQQTPLPIEVEPPEPELMPQDLGRGRS